MRLGLVLAIVTSVVLPLRLEAQGPVRPSLAPVVVAPDTVAGVIDPSSMLLTPWLSEPRSSEVSFEASAHRGAKIGRTVGLLGGLGLCLFDILPPSIDYTSPPGRWLGLSVPTHRLTEAVGGTIGLLLADSSGSTR
jgi:hypothetical protein